MVHRSAQCHSPRVHRCRDARRAAKAGQDRPIRPVSQIARSETPRSERAVATGTPDVLYVSELVGPDVVNTMPEKTLHAFAGLAPGLQPPPTAQRARDDDPRRVRRRLADGPPCCRARQRRTPRSLRARSVRRWRHPYSAVTHQPPALTAGGPMSGVRSARRRRHHLHQLAGVRSSVRWAWAQSVKLRAGRLVTSVMSPVGSELYGLRVERNISMMACASSSGMP